jgi:hypothetical protein
MPASSRTGRPHIFPWPISVVLSRANASVLRRASRDCDSWNRGANANALNEEYRISSVSRDLALGPSIGYLRTL